MDARVLLRLCASLALLLGAIFAHADSPVVQEVSNLRKSGKNRGWTFEVAPNQVMELPADKATGLVEPLGWKSKAHFYRPKFQVAELPARWDWREQAGGLTPIKNQGNCGSCWAFATAAVMESQLKIRDGISRNVSEQHLLSCNTSGWSCMGGWFAHALHQSPGVALGEDFPYVTRRTACKKNLTFYEKLESWTYLGDRSRTPSNEEIKAAIYEYGPVGVTVAATRSFMAYRGGVYNACDGRRTNHAVSLVGWDDNEGTWILRNTWGENWGEKGYMRIKYNCSKVGEATTFVVYKSKNCEQPPIAYTGADQSVAPGAGTMLGGMPVQGQKYQWSPAEGLDATDVAMPYANPSKTTTYSLKVENECGTADAKVTVEVK